MTRTFVPLARLASGAAALSTLLTSGCVDTTLSYVAPGFSLQQLQSRGVAVGPVRDKGSRQPLITGDEASMLRGELVSRLAHSRRVTSLIPVSGSSARHPYRLSVEITRNEVESWVSDQVSTSTETLYDQDGKPCGCVTHTSFTTSANTRRAIGADFRLVDPSSGDVVWAWSGEHADCNTYSNVSDFSYPPAPGFPPPPQTLNVADNLVQAAVRKLGKLP